MAPIITFGIYTAEVMRPIEAGELGDEDAEYGEIDVHADNPAEAKRLAQVELMTFTARGGALGRATGGLVRQAQVGQEWIPGARWGRGLAVALGR